MAVFFQSEVGVSSPFMFVDVTSPIFSICKALLLWPR